MREILQKGLKELGLDAAKAADLEYFSSLLLEKNKVMNLTAITQPTAVAQLHLLDSAFLLNVVDFSEKKVIDVGTGAGFPGIPLRILKHDFDLTLLDSLGKRVTWLEEACTRMNLPRTQCIHARAEEFSASHRETFDLALSRAVAQLNILAELTLPLVTVGGHFLAMKSVESDEELDAAKPAIKLLGGKICRVIDYRIPTSDISHRVVIIEKTGKTPEKYPRTFAKIKKNPL